MVQFDGQRSLEHVRHLAGEIGARLAGSPAAERAAAYVREAFRTTGLKVAEQEFTAHYGVPVSHGVEALDPPMGSIPSCPVLLSGDTPDEGVTGDLVVVEGNDPRVVSEARIAGRIVLWVATSRIEFQTRLEAMAEARPAAILVAWPAFGIPPKWQQLPEVTARRGMAVPAFCITFEQALALVAAGAKKVRVTLRSERAAGRTRNLVAEVTGSTRPDEIVLVGAHYDTAPEVSGAIDNASGVAIVLELARLYASRGSARTLRFVAWGAEKSGMVGSLHYVAAQQAFDRRDPSANGSESWVYRSLASHKLCISLDGVGVRLHRDVCYTAAEPEIGAALASVARELDVPLAVKDDYYGSDSEMFTQAGVPGVSFGQEGPALVVLHTPGDEIGMLDAQRLGRLGQLIDGFLSRTVAVPAPWPFSGSAPAAARERSARWLRAKGWIDLVPDGADLSFNPST